MTKDDINDEILQLLVSKNYTLFNRRFFNSVAPEPAINMHDLIDEENITIWVNNNKYQPRCSAEGTGAMTGQFLFDYYKDPIIEFDLGSCTDNLLSPGRLFYKNGWVNDKEVRDVHTKMTNKLTRTFKKRLITTNRLRPFYISESVNNLLNIGLRLELGQGGMIITKDNIHIQ